MPVDLQLADLTVFSPEHASGWGTKAKADSAKLEKAVPWYNILNFGAVAGTSSTLIAGNKAALDAALAACVAALGGTIYIPAGNFPVGDYCLKLPDSTQFAVNVHFDGYLQFSVDTATGIYAIRPDTTYGQAGTACFSQLTGHGGLCGVKGPNVSTVLGTFAANMRGIRMVHGMKATGLGVTGFHSGFCIEGDHNDISMCTATGNGFGIYMNCPPVFSGDHVWNGLRLDGNLISSVGVSATSINNGNITWTHGHMGFSPYAIYFEAGRAVDSVHALGSLLMLKVSSEGLGNGWMYDASGQAVVGNVTMIGCTTIMGQGAPPVYKIAAQPWRPFIRVEQFDNLWLYGCSWLTVGQSTNMGAFLHVDRFSSKFYSDNIEQLMTEMGTADLFRVVDQLGDFEIEGTGLHGRAVGLSSVAPAVTVGQLICMAGGNKAYPNAANLDLLGVAGNAVNPAANPNSKMLIVWDRHNQVLVDTTETVAFTAGALMVADPAVPTKVKRSIAGVPPARPSVGASVYGTIGSGQTHVSVNIK